MKNRSRTIALLLLCISLCMIFIPAVFAADEFSQIYDNNIITGFEPFEYEKTVSTEYKYAMVELQKEFPAEITVRVGGKVYFTKDSNDSAIIIRVTDFETKKIDIVWKCQENYDEDLDVFHFIPDLDDYKLAAGLELPVITVNNLDLLPIPPLMDLPEDPYHWVPVSEESTAPIDGLPSNYNGYTNGVLPSIRNQGQYGTCWAHATLAAIEADLIHDGKAPTTIDLSELHLIYFTTHNYYDEKNCNDGDTVNFPEEYIDGAHRYWASARLFNLLGPTWEENVPYSLNYSYQPSASEGRIGSIQVTDVYYLDINNRDSMKNAIMNHGAVTIDFDFDPKKYYSATNNSYYCPYDNGINHAVALVGWDDSFSAENFGSGTPEGDGAWLVRNSWGGTGYSQYSYFWMSYYDKSLDNEVIAYDAQLWRYDHVYSYDNSPYTNIWTYNSGDKASQKFHVGGNEQIEAIGFYTDVSITNVGFTLLSGNRSVSKTVSTITPGYHVIPLTSPFQIQNAADVTVQYTLTNSDGTFGAPFEQDTEWEYSAQCGSGLLLGDFVTGTDAKIKLFTNDLPDLVLPSNVETIESEAFAGGAFKIVKLSEKTDSIGYRAFADCPNLKRIYIPSTTTYIDPEAFGNNSGLIIEGVYGSYAERYASNNGYVFKPGS